MWQTDKAGRLTASEIKRNRRVYDRPVLLQKQDENTELWKTEAKLYCCVNKTGGTESFSANADQFHARLTFETRYFSVPENVRYQPQLYRLIYNGHTFNIVDYDDFMEQHQEIKIVGELYE